MCYCYFSSDSEFAEESFQVRTQSLKKVPSTQKNKKALSTDSGEIVGTSSGKLKVMEGSGREGGRGRVRTQSLEKVSPTQKNKKALSTDSGEIIGAS